MTRKAESRQLIYDGGWAWLETLLNRAPRRTKAPAAPAGQRGTEEGRKKEGGGKGRLVVCGKGRER